MNANKRKCRRAIGVFGHFLVLAVASLTTQAQPAGEVGTALTQPADPIRIPVHDPVIIRENGTYYIFAAGMGIAVWSSKDMRVWRREKPVFASPPAWAVEAVPTFRGHIWAPDISYY